MSILKVFVMEIGCGQRKPVNYKKNYTKNERIFR